MSNTREPGLITVPKVIQEGAMDAAEAIIKTGIAYKDRGEDVMLTLEIVVYSIIRSCATPGSAEILLDGLCHNVRKNLRKNIETPDDATIQ